jgi:cytoskeleton protein RodZ
LSAQKAADEMRLDRWVIDALEADDYKRIGPTVYAKGHLKKYASLLGLPAAEILAAYEARPPGPVVITSAGPSMLLTTRDEDASFGNWSPAQIVASVAVALLVAGVLWWKPWQQRSKTPLSAPPVATAPAAAAAEGSAGSGFASPAAAAPVTARDMPTAPAATPAIDSGVAAAAPDAAAGVPPPGAGRARLRLSFSADSWVDVRDANGKRTFAGNGLANSVKTIAGAAPLRVYLGFGSGVQLEVNDRAVAIGPQFFAGDVARFEAGADGVLRRDSRTDQPHAAPPRSTHPPG